ncbi:MAG: branched-chain amino acid ABC transporter permease [Candidatus Atribacteria bacterium]|nr:MAG: branched-chain amino acid ABC transporter permease [Candidatus Atribacteria bacterium]
MSFLDFLRSTLIIGFLESAPLMLAAVGFTLIFCLNGFINIAFAENLTVGAYLAVTFNAMLGWNFYISIIPASLLSGVLSVITYLVIFRPAMKRGVGKTEMIILSVGLSFVLRYGINLIYGSELFNYTIGKTYYLSFLGMGITSTQLICLGLVLIIALGFYLFMYKTNYGQTMRALADNENLAMISGIDPIRVSVLVWFLAGVAGGLAGIFTGVFTWVNSGIGWNMILVILLVAIIGKVGSVRGALIAGASIGVITTAVTLVTKPAYGEVALLVIFIIFLKFRKVAV